MASGADDNEDVDGASHGPRECMACRGTGRVISNLGGSPSQAPCPWCDGSGVRVPGIDAQARWANDPKRAAEAVAEGAAEDAAAADAGAPPAGAANGSPDPAPVAPEPRA